MKKLKFKNIIATACLVAASATATVAPMAVNTTNVMAAYIDGEIVPLTDKSNIYYKYGARYSKYSEDSPGSFVDKAIRNSKTEITTVYYDADKDPIFTESYVSTTTVSNVKSGTAEYKAGARKAVTTCVVTNGIDGGDWCESTKTTTRYYSDANCIKELPKLASKTSNGFNVGIHIVTFKSNGNAINTQYVVHGHAAKKPKKNPTKTGHTFAGWDKAFNNITGDTVVSAKWTKYNTPVAKSVNVTFYRNTSSTDKSTYNETYKYGAKNNKFGMNLKDKSGDFGMWKRSGYKMLGWAWKSTDTKANYSIYWNVTDNWINTNAGQKKLYAVWAKTYTVTFKNTDGKTYNNPQTVIKNKSAKAPIVSYTYSGKKVYPVWDKEFGNITGNLTVSRIPYYCTSAPPAGAVWVIHPTHTGYCYAAYVNK